MKAARIIQLTLPHVMVGLLTVGLVTFIPSVLYYAWAIIAGIVAGDFGGPLNFILIPLIFFVLGVALAIFITMPFSILVHLIRLRKPQNPPAPGSPP